MSQKSITKEEVIKFVNEDIKKTVCDGTVADIENLFCTCPCTGFLLKNGTFLTPEDLHSLHSELVNQEWIPSKDFHVIELCDDPIRVRCKVHFEWKGFDQRASKRFQASCINRYILGRKENGNLCLVSFQEKSRYYMDDSHDPLKEAR